MIKNYYYLTAGVLAILFSISHAWNGQITVLPLLNITAITTETKAIFFYVWHIITAENMLLGFVFLYMSVQKDASKITFMAWVFAILMILRLIVIIGGTLFFNASELKNIILDIVAIVIYVTIIVLGIGENYKNKVSRNSY